MLILSLVVRTKIVLIRDFLVKNQTQSYILCYSWTKKKKKQNKKPQKNRQFIIPKDPEPISVITKLYIVVDMLGISH